MSKLVTTTSASNTPPLPLSIERHAVMLMHLIRNSLREDAL